MRGGLKGFYVFIACIALGAMAIAGVGSLAASLNDGLAREGRVILGGDMSFSLIHREAKPEEVAFLQARGRVSSAATMRAMARTDSGEATLVEMKAIDGAYPLFGRAVLERHERHTFLGEDPRERRGRAPEDQGEQRRPGRLADHRATPVQAMNRRDDGDRSKTRPVSSGRARNSQRTSSR